MLRVGVLGAAGRMGQAVCAAVRSDPELELVALVDPVFGDAEEGPGPVCAAAPDVLATAAADVAIDFTVPGAALPNARWCAANGVHDVVGTTGFGDAEMAEMADLFRPGPANCVVAPNFAIGAVLMMRFAEMAAPWFETVEVIELHHAAKLDAPSGTARMTARRISAARGGRADGGAAAAGGPARGELTDGVRVHSVRLEGLMAHQEVLLGTAGQTLSIRHDCLDRSCFMPGVLMAAKSVPSRRGLTVGLDSLLGI